METKDQSPQEDRFTRLKEVFYWLGIVVLTAGIVIIILYTYRVVPQIVPLMLVTGGCSALTIVNLALILSKPEQED